MSCNSFLSDFMKGVKDVEKAYNASGHICIVDSIGSGTETEHQPVYTEEEVLSTRVVINTKNREKMLIKYESFSSSEGRTEDGNQIIFAMSKEIAWSLKQNTFVLQFDALFALTWSLYANDEWFYSIELWEKKGPLEKALNQLAQAWKKVLSKSDAALDIDSAFTRPGIEAFLDLFAAKVSDNGANSSYEFKWRPDNYPESGFIGSSEGHLGKRLATRLEPRKITKLVANSSGSSKKQKIAEDDAIKDITEVKVEKDSGIAEERTEVKVEKDSGIAEAILADCGSAAVVVVPATKAVIAGLNVDVEKGVAEAK